VDRAVLDESSNVRVRFLVSVSAAVFAVFLLLVSLVVAAFSLVRGYAPGVVVGGVVLIVAVLLGVAAGVGLLRR
jgi:hypothetical protein